MANDKSQRRILSDTIIEQLEAIISNMSPGERLPTENELSERFGVGRSTIREGLKVLSYRKIVVRKNEGTFVAEKTPEGCLTDPLNLILNMKVGSLLELIELREQIEIIVVKLAAQRASEEDITALEKCDWLFREPGISPELRKQRDFDFHMQLAQCAGNSILAGLVNAIRQVISTNLEKEPMPEQLTDEGAQLHIKIISAIREHNVEKAISCMEEYLLFVNYHN